MTDLLVLRRNFHGLPAESLAAELRERLPDVPVRVGRTPDRTRELIETASVAVGSHLDPDLLEAAGNLDLFACAYAGVDHLPMDELAARDVAVTTASGVHAPNIGEYVVGAVLAFTRRFHEARRRQRDREWRSYPVFELAGSTVAVVGLGPIGEAVVERLAGFDVDTIGVRYSPGKGGPTDEVLGFPAIHEALGRSEYVVLACPLTDETRGLIDRAALDTMGPDAVLVNVARGEIVDTDALVSALRGGHVRGAALDVTDPEPLPEDHPLWNLGNVMLTPHNAGATPEYHARLADIVAGNVRHARETGSYTGLENQVLP